MADAPEEADLQLQRTSADIITEFKSLLPQYLWRGSIIRNSVQQTKTNQLAQLVGPLSTVVTFADPIRLH